MPCSDGNWTPPSNPGKNDRRTAQVLCALCTFLEANEPEGFHFLQGEMPALKSWWLQHKAWDKYRQMYAESDLKRYKEMARKNPADLTEREIQQMIQYLECV